MVGCTWLTHVVTGRHAMIGREMTWGVGNALAVMAHGTVNVRHLSVILVACQVIV